MLADIARQTARNVARIIVAASFLASGAMVASMADDSDPTAVRPPAANTPAGLVESHDCWTGDAPAGVVAGHAVVTLPGRDVALVPARVGFAVWSGDRPGTLHAFCS